MNRYALCEEILRLKDIGAKRIKVILDGKEYEVPTKYSGEGSTAVSVIMNSEQENGWIWCDLNSSRYDENGKVKKDE